MALTWPDFPSGRWNVTRYCLVWRALLAAICFPISGSSVAMRLGAAIAS